MRKLYAEALGLTLATIPVGHTGWINPNRNNNWPATPAGQAPDWWALYSPLLNGQAWLDSFVFTTIQRVAGGGEVRINRDQVQAPVWLELTWDDSVNCVDYGSGRLSDHDNVNPTLFMPCMNLADMPAPVRHEIMAFARGSAEQPVPTGRMHEVHWFTVRLDRRFEQSTVLLTGLPTSRRCAR